jgi:hypothetical protein
MSVSLTSSSGAAVTVIDARTVPVNVNVLIITTDARFGKRGRASP